MTTTDAYILSCYREIAVLNSQHGITLVQHTVSGTVYVKKILETYNADVYEYLYSHHVKGTPEITEIFTGLLPRERRIFTASVQRPGTAPVKMACASGEEYRQRLSLLVRAAEDEEGLTAVICETRASLEKVRELLEDSLGADAPPVIRRNQALPAGGVFLIPLDLVKGLEFDGVIIPDADASMYPDDVLSRHRLYTAVSRATKRLSILADGDLTGLIG